MIEKVGLVLRVNELGRELEVEPRRILADVLRDEFQLRSVHLGCEQGACGGCTVLVDGEPILSCLVLAAELDGCSITTVEGLKIAERLHPLQATFADLGAAQCGYCTPGLLMAAKALLDRNPEPSRNEIRSALAGNLCRCTGYQTIVEAVELAAATMRGADQ